MSTLKNERLILEPLTPGDSTAFYALYQSDFRAEEPLAFTKRIISLCVYIWSIRLLKEPEKIIGDCALHHYNISEGSVEIGGSLLADFQGKSIMRPAMEMVIEFATRNMLLQQIIGRTTSDNIAAVNLVKRLGFSVISNNGQEIVLSKKV